MAVLALAAAGARHGVAGGRIPGMTYSIVARCPDSGMLGIGIASHVLAVGRVAPYIEPGIGVVATQSLVLMAHGERTLASMRQGVGPAEALAASLALDETPHGRQVAAVAADGSVAAYSGPGCIPFAGDVQGDGFSTQANMMANPGVPEAMAAAFTASNGQHLALRILAALDAAESVGGDIRGRQSAALIIAAPESSGDPLVDRLVDVRVDDSAEPLPELRRLTRLALANQRLDVADALLTAGDVSGAAAAYRQATEQAPDFIEFSFWQAVALADAGDPEGAGQAWATIAGSDEAARWVDLLDRVIDVGLVSPEARVALRGEAG
jgi:uncharacterized Ntn-hydrolase superfamily protein